MSLERHFGLSHHKIILSWRKSRELEMEYAFSCLLLLQEIPWFGWWNVHFAQRLEGDPAGKSIRTGHGLCCLLSHDLSFQFHTESGYRLSGPEIKHRKIATKAALCVDCETCLIQFFSKYTPLASTASCDNDFKNLYENVAFVSNPVPHKFIISFLVLRLWETVSNAF